MRAVREAAGGGEPIDLEVDPGVEGVAPEVEEDGVVAARLAGIGARQEDHVVRQARAGGAELVCADDGEQGVAAEGVAAGVRHLEADAGQAAVALDDAPDEPGVRQDGPRRGRGE